MEQGIQQAATEFEKEKKKIERALEFTNGDLEKAKKLVSGEIRDIAVIKARFNEDDVKLFGAFIFFINLELSGIERIHTLITFDKGAFKTTPYAKWSEFENSLIDLQWKKEYLTAQSQELKTAIENNYAFESMSVIMEALNNKNEKKISDILNKVVAKTLNLDTFKLEVGLEFINKFNLKYEGRTDAEDKKEEAKEAEAQQQETYIKEGEVLLNAECEISPIRGININKLTPGMEILVRLREESDKDRYFINMFNAREGKKIIPLKAVVRLLTYDETFGFMVIAELGPGVVVKCLEAAQINVKTPQIAAKEKGSKTLVRVILVIGALLLLLGGLYVYLSLKGII